VPGDVDPRYVNARTRLLDALDALEVHHAGLTLVGAQAVYMRTGPGDLLITPFTLDGDLAVDPALLAHEPLIEVAMISGGFTRGDQPGCWLSTDFVSIDLLAPASVAGRGRRSVEMPPHDKNSARRTNGLEGALVDRSVEVIVALDPSDTRTHRIGVAGPAALIVAKAHKLGERVADSSARDRTRPKDALDIYRLLVAYDADVLAESLGRLLADNRSSAATRQGVVHLEQLFDSRNPVGAELAAHALAETSMRNEAMQRSFGLAQELLSRLRTQE
jgi:hypothetical protein